MKTPLITLAALSLFAGSAAADTNISASVTVATAASGGPVAADTPKQKGPPPWAPAHGHRAKFAYKYYPAQQVYQRQSDGMWFFLQNGTWAAGLRLPSTFKVDAGSAVALHMDTDRPFTFHTEVRAVYRSAAKQDQEQSRPEKPHGKGNGKGKRGNGANN